MIEIYVDDFHYYLGNKNTYETFIMPWLEFKNEYNIFLTKEYSIKFEVLRFTSGIRAVKKI